jgi:hypothetical protein
MKNLLLIIGVLIILFACKKSSTTTTSATLPNTPTALSYTIDAHGNPSGMYSGVFYVDSIYFSSSYPNIYSSGTSMYCFFLTMPQSYQNISVGNYTNTPVNSVIVNGDKFGGSLQYQDSMGISISAPYKWVVNGKGVIPSFTYTCATPQPIYSGFLQLPNVISLQQNLSLPLSGASNYDVFSISIFDTTNFNKYIGYLVLNTASSITIPKDSLAKFSSGTGVKIATTLTKYNPQSVGGKNFLFITQFFYQKIATIQ